MTKQTIEVTCPFTNKICTLYRDGKPMDDVAIEDCVRSRAVDYDLPLKIAESYHSPCGDFCRREIDSIDSLRHDLSCLIPD